MIKTTGLGDKMAEFNLKATKIKNCTNAHLSGKWTILFLYPKDNTSGCTKENQDFNKFYEEFVSNGTQIFGLSKDSIESHEKFSKKLSLNFPLISDPDCTLINNLSCWVEKSMYGKKYMGVERSTFLINPDSKISYVWRKVKVKDHVEEVLSKLKEVRSL